MNTNDDVYVDACWESAAIEAVGPEHCSYPPRRGHELQFWIDGVDLFRRLEQAYAEAQDSAWAIVSFISPEFRLPSGRDFFDCCQHSHARGLDTRVLFWRNTEFFSPANIFHGHAAHIQELRTRALSFAMRWDDSKPVASHCHHQKLWLFDAGKDSARAFVGGMVLGPHTLDDQNHRGLPRSVHDVFIEVQGPAVHDVAHNFTQRWNQARQNQRPPFPSEAQAADLASPPLRSEARGSAQVQITRSLAPNRYRSTQESSSLQTFDGEDSIRRSYLEAFAKAQNFIYLENQHPGELSLLTALESALKRGVEVFLLVPAEPMLAISQCKRESEAYAQHRTGAEPRYFKTFQKLAELAQYEGWTMAELSVDDGQGGRRPVYVHSKTCVVDGRWGTSGSANLVDLSLCKDHTELNIQFWSPQHAQELFRRLAREHLDLDWEHDSERSGRRLFQRLRDCAQANAEAAQSAAWRGRVRAVDARRYGL